MRAGAPARDAAAKKSVLGRLHIVVPDCTMSQNNEADYRPNPGFSWGG
jgi:hypothetical protein